MSRTGDRGEVPRAMVHRQILDVAAADADASMEAIADEVSGASVRLVERVLDEYGDPAETPAPATTESETGAKTDAPEPAEPTMSQNGTKAAELSTNETGETLPEWGDLSEKQRATLRAVAENPAAPQETVADRLGVTRATVSRRLNDVPGFEWNDREAFVRPLIGEDSDVSAGEGTDDAGTAVQSDDAGTAVQSDDAGTAVQSDDAGTAVQSDDAGTAVQSDDATSETVTELERRVAALEDGQESTDLSVKPDLAHRVVHACMESDRISENEELQLLRAFM